MTRMAAAKVWFERRQTGVIEWLTERLRLLDARVRWWDLAAHRTVGGRMTRYGISRHTRAAVLLPSLLVLMMVNGPALRPTGRLVLAIVSAILARWVFRATLRRIEQRGGSIWQDLVVQVVLLLAVGGALWWASAAVWGAAAAIERSDAWLYQHALIPLTALVGLSLLAGGLLAATLFRSPLGRETIPRRLTEVELFVSLPEHPHVTWGILGVAAVGAVTSTPLRVLVLPALGVLLVERDWVMVTFWSTLAVNLLLLAFANVDPRFDASWTLLHRWATRGFSALVSLLVIALGLARVADFQYVTTVFDGARNWTIGGYLAAAYVLTWWWDYWTSTLISIRFLDLLGGRGGATDARIEYTIQPTVPRTSVPAEGRVIQSHGPGRLLVLNESGGAPRFHTYDPAGLAQALAMGLPPKEHVHSDLDWVRWRLDAHFLLASLVVVVLLGGTAWGLSRLPQVAHIDSREKVDGLREVTTTILPASTCQDAGVVVAVAASGGGTRAALYTTAVLERLRRMNRLGDITVVSGVSGGGAALAYFAARRAALLSSSPDDTAMEGAWNAYYAAMQQPYIEDVIDGSGEWRIATNHRLGRLLAESFTRHWRAQTRFADVDGVGILLNSAIAGRFEGEKGSSRSLADQEAEKRSGKSDVAGGRVVYTNLNLDDHFGNPDLFDHDSRDTREARLPVFVIEDPDVTLAAAAAANANFPPVFSNAPIDRAPGLRLWVTDGGAIDNRGTETLLMAIKRAILDRKTCARLPALHILEAEASAFSDSYSQDRGLGSMMSAGTAFASQLDSELLTSIRDLYKQNGQDPVASVSFHFVPMPSMLRRSGSFGTHWMMQERIAVCEQEECARSQEIVLTGMDMVTILRNLGQAALPNGASEEATRVHAAIRRETSDHTVGWARVDTRLGTRPPAKDGA